MASLQDSDNRIPVLEMEVRQKDKIIEAMRSQLDEQKEMRIQDAKLVEEKSAKIKEWVSKKLKEVLLL